jgi:hypothetical protein
VAKPGTLATGRPSKDVMKLRYQAQRVFFDETVVSEKDIADIVKRAVADAKDGNAAARDFVAAYRFGRPKPMDEGVGLTINIEGDDTQLALLSREQLELLVSIKEAPLAIEDGSSAMDDDAIDAEYRPISG